MEKQKISFIEKDEYFDLEYNGFNIKVKTYIPLAERYILTDNFVENILDTSMRMGGRYIQADLQFRLGVVDLCTNIDVDDDFDIDKFFNSGLYEKITEHIENYGELIDDMYGASYYAREEFNGKQTVSHRLAELVDMIDDFLAKISSVDLSTEGVSNLIAGMLNAQKEFNDKYAIDEPELDFAKAIAEVSEEKSKPKPKKKAK